MRTFNRVFAVSQMILCPRAARLISRSFFGTTDETTTVRASRRRRMLAILRAFKEGVAIFEARSIRDREANASLVKELLTSMRRKSGFVRRLRMLSQCKRTGTLRSILKNGFRQTYESGTQLLAGREV